MPVVFDQTPDLRPKPNCKIQRNQIAFELFQSNVAREIKALGFAKILYVNLIDNRGVEGELAFVFLGQVVRSLVERAQDFEVQEIAVNNGQIEFLSLNKQDFLQSYRSEKQSSAYKEGVMLKSESTGYIHLDYHKTISKNPAAGLDLFKILFAMFPDYIPRINCVDSLDRTNTVCSYYFQLYATELSQNYVKEDTEQSCLLMPNEALIREFINIGNKIALQYASSEAMKQDITLLNQRTCKGKLKDLKLWMQRAIRNNLVDGKLQSGYNILSGCDVVYIRKHGINILLYWALVLIILSISIVFLKQENAGYILLDICVVIGLGVVFMIVFNQLFVALPEFQLTKD